MTERTAIYDPAPATAGPAEAAKGHKPAKVAAAATGAAGLTLIILTVLQSWTPAEITGFCDRVGVPALFTGGLLWVAYKVGMRGISAVFIGVKDFNGNLAKLNTNVEHIADSVSRQLDRNDEFDKRMTTSLTTLLSRTEFVNDWLAQLFQRVDAVERRVGLAPAGGGD